MNGDYAVITDFIARRRRALAVSRAVNRSAGLAAGCFLMLAVFQISFSFFPWTVLPLLWDLTILSAVLGSAGIFLDAIFIHGPSLKETARRIEREASVPRPLISIAAEFPGTSPWDSAALRKDVLRRARETLGKYPRSLKNLYAPRLLLCAAAALLVCIVTSIAVSPPVFSYWNLPFKSGISTAVSIEPGTVAVPQDSAVVVRCIPRKRVVPSCRLTLYSTSGVVQKRLFLRAGSSGAFAHRVRSVDNSFGYSFSLGGTRVNNDTITAVPPPILYLLRVTLHPPPYTGFPQKELFEGEGSFAAYAGTRADFTVASVSPLDSAALVKGDGTVLPLAVGDSVATGQLTVTGTERYTFALADTFGRTADSIPWFSIDRRPDLPPVVNILHPGASQTLSPAQVETLLVEGIDDIGIKSLAVHWRKNSMPEDSIVTEKMTPQRPRMKILRKSMVWDMKPLSLYPGDTVFYWAHIRDNKPFGNKQVASSDTFWFRVPGFREIHKKIAKKESAANEALGKVKKTQESTREKLTNLIRSAKGNKRLSWEEKEIVKELSQEMEAQRDSLKKALDSFTEAVEKLKEEQYPGDNVLDKMDEVRRELEALIREYGDSVLFTPPDKEEKLTWNDMKNALRKAERLLPELEQRLENTLKYLDMLRQDQELAALAAHAEKLAAEQQRVAQESESDAGNPERQKNLNRRMDSFAERVRRRSSEQGDDPLFSLDDIPSLSRMESGAESLKQETAGNRMPSQAIMNAMSGTLLSLSDELQSMLSSSMMARMEKEKKLLLDMANDALSLAEWEKEAFSGNAPYPAAQTQKNRSREFNTQTQQAIREALKQSMEKLDSLTVVSPAALRQIAKSYDRALSTIDNSLKGMEMSRGRIRSGKQARAALNSLAQTLLNSSGGMNKSQGSCGSGRMCGLRKLSGKQAMANAATGELLRQLLEGKNSGGMKEGGSGKSIADQRKAARNAQKAIADKLKELADKYGEEAGDDLEKRVENLEKEARRLAEMLENPSQQVKDRQDRFLVRMLQTTLSTHREDQGREERKSASSQTIFSADIPAPDAAASQNADTFYRLRKNALEGNFPEEYRFSIQAYFDSLGVMFLK
ncbi:MAG: hypothetical protein GF350_11070 [Chitinivibrionales bacterium]|nr:hypothetical protein [Chitinivibrionales bacterium]